MKKLIKQHSGQGELMFDKNESARVAYLIDEIQELTPDGVPTLRDRRGWVSHMEGHPDWHPIVLAHPGPFTLVLADGRRLKVIFETPEGSIQGTGEFF